jgi:hypothetical protein
MAEQKSDKGIRRMEKEQRKLGHIMGIRTDEVQRVRTGGWT